MTEGLIAAGTRSKSDIGLGRLPRAVPFELLGLARVLSAASELALDVDAPLELVDGGEP